MCSLVLSSESSSSANKTRFESKRTASGTACGWIDPMSQGRWPALFFLFHPLEEGVLSSAQRLWKRSQRDHKNPRTKCKSVGSREPIQAQEMAVNCSKHLQGTHHQDHNLHLLCQRSIRPNRCPRRVASMNLKLRYVSSMTMRACFPFL